VPPMLNLPWTNGMRNLFDLFRESSVSGIMSGVWPSPQSEIVKHGLPSRGGNPVRIP